MRETPMRRFLPLICVAALVFGACRSGPTPLTPLEETGLKLRLVVENSTAIPPPQRAIFLHTRFGTEEMVYAALERMLGVGVFLGANAARNASSPRESGQ